MGEILCVKYQNQTNVNFPYQNGPLQCYMYQGELSTKELGPIIFITHHADPDADAKT